MSRILYCIKIFLWPVLLIATVISVVVIGYFLNKSESNNSAVGWQSERPYINSKYGFSFNIPENWNSYFIREEMGEYGEIEIVVSLPTKSHTLGKSVSFFEESNGFFDLWRIHIFTPDLYKFYEHTCEDVDYPCLFPNLAIQNTQYVIAEGRRSVPGSGWDPCADEAIVKEDQNFCNRLEMALQIGKLIEPLQ